VYFSFPLSVPFHQCSIFFFNHMLLYQEDSQSKPGKQRSFGNRGALDKKVLSHFNLRL
jgi:hypothetical protein